MGKNETPTVGQLIDRMEEIRVQRRKLAAQDEPLEEEYKTLKTQVMELLDKQGSDGAKTGRASVSITSSVVCNVVDIDTFARWALRNKMTHLFTRSCVSAPSYREVMELKKSVPPGTEPFTKRDLNHTSLKKGA